MDDQARMAETMNEIYGTTSGNKDELLKDITNLETHIKSAQEVVIIADESWSSYTATVTPEQANERRKDIVFMKRDLESKQSEYEELSK